MRLEQLVSTLALRNSGQFLSSSGLPSLPVRKEGRKLWGKERKIGEGKRREGRTLVYRAFII